MPGNCNKPYKSSEDSFSDFSGMFSNSCHVNASVSKLFVVYSRVAIHCSVQSDSTMECLLSE